MAGLLIEERRGIALMEATRLLPEKYSQTHVPSRVTATGYDPIRATVTFSPCYTYCCPVVKVTLVIQREESDDELHFRANVQEYKVAPCTHT